ncbi:hypothetical protein A2617_03765 [Candidatus Daviesbacteria bacterium RIFOXYD1_FULL_41_10]|uniref:Uncharacterized protein n=1 Tax=Candidatus Daviesbacteria bacterium RIFOXYD1_FULL_41_10 TaxID=1797801 RepID=A0A1F5MZX0_9BACT|nr:MAG: hypothetical protein A2617_03765 [Candidatus Daviesbacteria bacterium RIFOXYD1_FULL_41_10]
MKKIVILIICSIVIVGLLFGIFGRKVNQSLISANLQIPGSSAAFQPTPTPPPTAGPTPTPITLDKTSNLENELEKLAPDSFTEDFKLLKKETNRF